MTDSEELKRAWPAAEPAPGFSDRVLERWRRAEAPRETTLIGGARSGWAGSWRAALRARPLAVMGLAALFVALALSIVRWPFGTAAEGELLASEPRSVSIGARAIAELSRGASIRWRSSEVQQDAGQVRYRVQPGGPFAVQTPFGRVEVVGTVFQVSVAGADVGDPSLSGDPSPHGDPSPRSGAEGEAMNKRNWAIAGTSAALGALLFVNVEQGTVRLSKGENEVVLGSGQAGVIGRDGVPRSSDTTAVNTAPPASAVDGVPSAGASEAPSARPEAHRMSPEERVALRTQMRERLRAAAARPAAPAPSTPSSAEPARPPVSHTVEEYGKALSSAIERDFGPLAQDCYSELLRRKPGASGDVVMDMKIIAETSVGGIVDSAGVTDQSTLRDDEFETCLTESFLSMLFGTMDENGEATIPDYVFHFKDGKADVSGEIHMRDRRNEGPVSKPAPVP